MTRRLSYHRRPFAIGVTVFLLAPGLAFADVGDLMEMTSGLCSEESRQAIADSAQANIDNYIDRALAEIDAPIPVGDLSCLSGLMENSISQSLSTLSGSLGSMGGFAGVLSNGVSSADIQNVIMDQIGVEGGDIGQAVCGVVGEQVSAIMDGFTGSGGSGGSSSATPSAGGGSTTTFGGGVDPVEDLIDVIPDLQGDASGADVVNDLINEIQGIVGGN